MGKPKKLRSSIKAIHDALTSFRPAVGAPMCIQPAKTHSFRELLTSFNSIYYAPPTSASSVSLSDPRSHHSLLHYPQNHPSMETSPICKVEGDEEEAVSISATATSTSTCSSCLSSSSSVAVAATGPGNNMNEAEADAEAFPSSAIPSERFFFSPCTSKSIMDEPFPNVGSKKIESLHRRACSEPKVTWGHAEEDDLFHMILERKIDTMMEETTTTWCSTLCRESIPMAMASRDPYSDFRSSMEEMVEANGLRDWASLQELLHCYLGLNEKKTHKFIVLAFMDVLEHLTSEGKVQDCAMHDFSSPTISSPLFPPPSLHPCPPD